MSAYRPARLGIVLSLLLAIVQAGYGQRMYATGVAVGGSGVTNPSNAISSDGVTEPTATPRARISRGGAGNAGTSYIQLQFPSTIPQNNTVFVRVSNETTGVLNGSITLSAYENESSRDATSQKFTATNGDELYAVNVTGGAFNQVRITAVANVIGSASINIFYAFHEPANPVCATVLGTTTNITGITLGSITNPERAIDQNLTSYSNFSTVLAIGSTLNQEVYFSNLSNPGEAATITFSVPPAILTLGLFNNITVSAYNGKTPVSASSLSSLLSLDLLGLLNGGNRYTVSYVPNGAFDRIKVSMLGTVGLLGTLRVHEIERTPAKPQVPVSYPAIIEVCDGAVASITATSPSTGSILRWYDAVNDGTLLKESTGEIDTYTTPPLNFTSISDTTFLYVASSWKTGCPAESERTKIAIVVRERPIPPNVSDNNSCINQPVTLSVSSPLAGITYRWYTVASAGTTIFTGNDYLISNPVATTTYYVESYNANTGCASVTRTAAILTVHPLPVLTLLSNAMTCEGVNQIPFPYTVINGGDEYQLTWDEGTFGSFLNISDWTALPESEIPVAIPVNATPGTYTGKIAIRNAASGCEGEIKSFSIQVFPKPGKPHLTISDVIN